jgi:hypothetical protein
VKRYEPKHGTGWEEGPSPLDNVRRWRTPLGGGVYLQVTVAEDAFIIARAEYEGGLQPMTAPMPEDLGRIEAEFGVRAWKIVGIRPPFPPSTGQVLLAQAVDVPS